MDLALFSQLDRQYEELLSYGDGSPRAGEVGELPVSQNADLNSGWLPLVEYTGLQAE